MRLPISAERKVCRPSASTGGLGPKPAWRRLSALPATRGMDMIGPEQGLEAFAAILQGSLAQVAVLPIDWTRYLLQFQAGLEPALLRALAGEARAAKQPAPAMRQVTRPDGDGQDQDSS